MRRFDGRYDWNEAKTLNEHVDYIIHHEVSLFKDNNNLLEKIELQKVESEEKFLREQTHASERLTRQQASSDQKLGRQEEQLSLRIEALQQEVIQANSEKDESHTSHTTKHSKKDVMLGVPIRCVLCV